MYKAADEVDIALVKTETAVKNNEFISTISNKNRNYLSEKEKQAIYLLLNDVLPWDLNICCHDSVSKEDKLERPSNTSACGKDFALKETAIFKAANNYYQRCSNCGYISNIPKELLVGEVRKRIDLRNKEKPDLLRANLFASEIQAEFEKDKILIKLKENS